MIHLPGNDNQRLNQVMIQTKIFFIAILCFCLNVVHAQVAEKVGAAYRKFTGDAQMKYGISSLLVIDAKSGKTVFASNESIGLAPASTLKVITAATALDVLGTDFVFNTPFLYSGSVSNGHLIGDVIVQASGDPTLGSWRYAATKNFTQITQLENAFNQAGIKVWTGAFVVDANKFGTQSTPGGWTFDDMGNYYGAGAQGINWHENQYDLVLKPGNEAGQPVKIAGTKPINNAINLDNELITGAIGSGDQAIIYPDKWPGGTVRGTVPAGVKEFIISGSIAETLGYWQKSINQYGVTKGNALFQGTKVKMADSKIIASSLKTFITLKSPSLDSLVYFFLQKSINLYGEALVKQLAVKSGKEGTTENGVKWMRDYWQDRGIDKGAMRIVDGSGLSPHNRVTTSTLVQVMQHARKQKWYSAFYEGLPTINGIKMKSGSISGVRGYTGYVKSSSGDEFIFAFLVNNFEGTSAAIMQKMFTVLNALK
jgi:D-alanyl-D-alanine carboxypeptidase/D-alanyl-D-alanine-endopeptidase (penicillin-binding protein 4)